MNACCTLVLSLLWLLLSTHFNFSLILLTPCAVISTQSTRVLAASSSLIHLEYRTVACTRKVPTMPHRATQFLLTLGSSSLTA